ncbi:Rqc2 RqcH [Paenibacillus sp. CECT 9249]|uniref:Rqc2 family fibronectin-binding protein n=1 Tax=Paenibacillus sp. CECT 9249 TaxID=2845385 RepID=UPI001E428064|nr:NFACT RNA binding domain-containing protein [Paenibacillus sp. CECT 9249]CAH0120099.1 Rqc2 RqcH [Paenibacillus sp. CECT 9249]
MALDGIVTRAVVAELQRCVGSRINKIYQPTEHDLVFQLRSQGENVKLLLSANPTYPRVHLTQQQFLNPQEAPMFCMLMRKHCEGAVIESVRQVEMERIIHIEVRQRDELGDISVKRIVIELMGRHSNIILTDPPTGTIVDGIHHVTPAISSYRIVMPGFGYVAPPQQHKRHPLEVAEDEFAAIMTAAAEPDAANGEEPAAARETDIAHTLVDRFSGLSPLIAREIEYRSRQEAPASATSGLASLWRAFAALMQDVRDNRYAPTLAENEKGKTFFSAVALTAIEGKLQTFDTISACMQAFYGDKALRDTVKQRVGDLIRFVQNEKNKNVKKIDKLRESLEEAKDADQYRIAGELLFASIHQIERGQKEIEVVNYYDEEQRPIRIALDPLLSPSENAQRYLKKYNKYKNSLAVIEQQMDMAQEEIRYFESLLQQLEQASLHDIDEIREELIEQGYLRDRAKKTRKKKKSDKPTVQCFTSSEGIPIYVGKNNIQNEYVTNRLANPSDTWLHTKDIPGSHVVIRGTDYSDATLEEAAQLAAYFSQAKQSSMVPVDYTLIRHVRKPNGAKPGFVIYENQKTLYITPDEQKIKSMPSTLKNN